MKFRHCLIFAVFLIIPIFWASSGMAALCTKASAGQYCVALQLKDCAPGCYCTGGNNFTWVISEVPKGCSERWGSISDINSKGVYLCPSDFPSSDSKASAATSCYYLYNGTKIYNKNVNCSSGQYMPANSNSCAACPANSYCPGGTYHTGKTNRGITACPSSYPKSASSSSSQNSCYRDCTTSDITYSTAVSGKYYYNNNNQCSAQSCQTGAQVSGTQCSLITYECSAGTYLPANSTSCTTCPAGSYCAGGGYLYTNSNQGIKSCSGELGSGWTSNSGQSSKTSCYYPVALNKNGFSGTISSGSGTGCVVASTASGTASATLKLFYNTSCTLPVVNLTQNGYTNATGWSLGTEIGSSAVLTIAATSSTPSVKTYYARKTSCAQNYYKVTNQTCSACGVHSNTSPANVAETCNCDTGYSLDGTSDGVMVSTTGCREIGTPVCPAGKYVPAETAVCQTCPAGGYCPGGEFTTSHSDQGLNYCVNEIDAGWTSAEGSVYKTDCYYTITLNKNGFDGTISANSGTGCQVSNSASGTNNATLKLFYNTNCTLPTVNLTQTGYTNATGWSEFNTVGSPATITITGPTTSPAVTTYYARKTGCGTNYYYVSATDACSACGINSATGADNMANTCVCTVGYSIDGTPTGSSNSVIGCSIISVTCDAGNYLPANSSVCQICEENNYCGGGTFDYSAYNQGITICPNSYVSPSGSAAVGQCGRILRVDNDMLYLRSEKRTIPSINVDINNDGIPDLFGNMTQTNIPIRSGSSRKLQLEYNGQTWFVYDDTSM